MTTDSQPSERPKSTAKFAFPKVVHLGTLQILSPEEREEWKHNSPSLPPVTNSQPSEQDKSTATPSFPKVVHLGTLQILSPEEREEWKRNSPSSATESRQNAEPPATD